jgi:hypothetical protein
LPNDTLFYVLTDPQSPWASLAALALFQNPSSSMLRLDTHGAGDKIAAQQNSRGRRR